MTAVEDPPVAVVEDPQLLFEEARQRRRRRWLTTGGVVMILAAALAVVIAALSSHGGSHSLGPSATPGPTAGAARTGPHTSVTPPKPVNACSLMSGSEARAIFPVAESYDPTQHASDNKQSYCSYPGSTQGTYVLANVTWSPAELSTYQKVHDGHHPSTGGTLPSGGSVPAPAFVKVVVDGDVAYWVAHQPLPVPGTTNHPSFMTATKNGYLVSLSAMGLTESQNEQILSTMLRRL